ncbi:unnamed protein product [Brassica oleracea]
MIFFDLGVWQICVVVLAISKAIRRKPYRDRVPPFSSPVISPITTNLICNRSGPHLLRPYLLRPYLLRKYLLRLLLLKDYSDDFQEVFYDVLLSGRLTCLKMDLPELSPRMFTVGEEPAAIRSISYHSDDTKLFKALCDCLTADEYEDLKASKLGVFIKFKELGFGWTSRLFEHLTGLNCDYIKDLENPRCEVTKEMAAFWEKMSVDLDTGPRKKFSTSTRDSLARLVMDLEKFENYPWGRVAFKVLMDSLKAKDLTQTGNTVDGFIQVIQINVNNFVQKDLDEMFPEWDGDVEDPAADNIIKVMFNDYGWKWTMDCWQVTGTQKVVKMEVSPVKTEATTAPAPGSDGFWMTKEQIERAFKDIYDAISDGFGTCLKEIKLLGDRMGAVEKKVGITKKGSSSNDLQLTTTSNPPKPVHEPGVSTKTSPKIAEKRVTRQSVRKNDLPSDEPSVLILDKQVPTASDLLLEEARRQTKKETAMVNLREKSERERKLAPTQQTPFKGNNTAKQIIPNKKVGRGYDPFAPYDKKKSKELTEWLEQDPSYKLPLKKKPRRCPSRFYHVLRTSLEWLTDHQMNAFINLLRQRYQDHPQHFRSERMCFLDHIFLGSGGPPTLILRATREMPTVLGRRLPVVWDNIIKHIRPEELDEPYTYEKQTVGVPQCRAGDCAPFTLKYIECHALGMEFPKAFCTRNENTIREKMAVDIFQELPMCHEWETQENDEHLWERMSRYWMYYLYLNLMLLCTVVW